MAITGWKLHEWLEMAWLDWKWLELAGIRWTWQEWLEMSENGWNLLKMAGNSWKWQRWCLRIKLDIRITFFSVSCWWNSRLCGWDDLPPKFLSHAEIVSTLPLFPSSFLPSLVWSTHSCMQDFLTNMPIYVFLQPISSQVSPVLLWSLYIFQLSDIRGPWAPSCVSSYSSPLFTFTSIKPRAFWLKPRQYEQRMCVLHTFNYLSGLWRYRWLWYWRRGRQKQYRGSFSPYLA